MNSMCLAPNVLCHNVRHGPPNLHELGRPTNLLHVSGRHENPPGLQRFRTVRNRRRPQPLRQRHGRGRDHGHTPGRMARASRILQPRRPHLRRRPRLQQVRRHHLLPWQQTPQAEPYGNIQAIEEVFSRHRHGLSRLWRFQRRKNVRGRPHQRPATTLQVGEGENTCENLRLGPLPGGGAEHAHRGLTTRGIHRPHGVGPRGALHFRRGRHIPLPRRSDVHLVALVRGDVPAPPGR